LTIRVRRHTISTSPSKVDGQLYPAGVMTRIALIAVGTVVLATSACSVPTRVQKLALHASAPGLAGESGPFAVLDPGTRPESRDSATDGGRNPEKDKPAASRQASGGASQRAAAPTPAVRQPAPARTAVLMVPASGDARARLARSARRLVGIRKSFDGRSFIGHLLAICDRLPRGASSAAWTAGDVRQQAEKAGTLVTRADRPVVGDIVFFSCGSGCGADAHEGTGAGVVIEESPDGPAFVAYHDGVVKVMKGMSVDQLTGSCPP